jgi:hypothetical protein
MSMNPALIKPSGSFSDALVVAPHAVASADAFKVALYGPDGIQLGWLGQNGSEWAILVTDPKQALILESYPYGGIMYYRIRGTSRYMSVSSDADAQRHASDLRLQSPGDVTVLEGQRVHLRLGRVHRA